MGLACKEEAREVPTQRPRQARSSACDLILRFQRAIWTRTAFQFMKGASFSPFGAARARPVGPAGPATRALPLQCR
jgi:hypothetical protein